MSELDDRPVVRILVPRIEGLDGFRGGNPTPAVETVGRRPRAHAGARLELLADALAHPATAGRRLLLRVPLGRKAGPAAPGKRRAHPRLDLVPRSRGRPRLARRRLRALPEPVLARRLGRDARGRGLVRRRAVAPARRGLRQRPAARAAVGALYVARPRGAGVVRLRRGDPAPIGGLPDRVPVPAPGPALVLAAASTDGGAVAFPLAHLPHHARRRAHQAARRRLLAGAHLPRPPLPPTAAPQPAVALVPLPSADRPQARGALQPPGRAGVVLACAGAGPAAPAADRGRARHAGVPDLPHPERQSVVPELP